VSALVVLLGGRVPMWVEGGRGWVLDLHSGEWRALDVFTAFGGRALREDEVQTVVTLYGRPQQAAQGVERG
jgi:hypothetical protein